MLDLHGPLTRAAAAAQPETQPAFEALQRLSSRRTRRQRAAVLVGALGVVGLLVSLSPLSWLPRQGTSTLAAEPSPPVATLPAPDATRAGIPITPPLPGDGNVTGRALLTGTLGLDEASGCLFVEDKDGRTQIVLRDVDIDRTARPAVVRSPGGTATVVGEQVRVFGGFGPEDGPRGVEGCPVPGTPFFGAIAN